MSSFSKRKEYKNYEVWASKYGPDFISYQLDDM